MLCEFRCAVLWHGDGWVVFFQKHDNAKVTIETCASAGTWHKEMTALSYNSACPEPWPNLPMLVD